MEVFTTRPDTLCGATYMVVAPEHPLLDRLTAQPQQEAVQAYVQAAASKSDLERTELQKGKTGVPTGACVGRSPCTGPPAACSPDRAGRPCTRLPACLRTPGRSQPSRLRQVARAGAVAGRHAVNPATGEAIPIWVADYVLGSYGSGAIMAVPAHDQRDHEFAQAFGLPIRQVVEAAPDAQLPVTGAPGASVTGFARQQTRPDGCCLRALEACMPRGRHPRQRCGSAPTDGTCAGWVQRPALTLAAPRLVATDRTRGNRRSGSGAGRQS